jgi:hypothetical protein
MSTFRNLETGVVVSVADDKDSRFASGWEPVTDKPAPKKAASKSDSK